MAKLAAVLVCAPALLFCGIDPAGCDGSDSSNTAPGGASQPSSPAGQACTADCSAADACTATKQSADAQCPSFDEGNATLGPPPACTNVM